MKAEATNRKISWFKREYEADCLDLSPRFQRNPVWSDEQASYLIDSILAGLPVPEIYVRSSSTSDGTTMHEVVDGQQRLRSLLRFGSNDLELVGDDVAPRLINNNFEDLAEAEKIAFWDYSIVVRDLSGATDQEVRDVFRRLNLNSINLNDQELRHARYEGRFISAVEALADDEWWVEVGVANLRQVRRMLDVEFVAELLVGLMAGAQDKKKNLDDYFEDYETEFPGELKWRRLFRRTRETLEEILGEELRNWRSKTEFYGIFLAVGSLLNEGFRFSDDHIASATEVLAEFRESVDQAKKRDNKVEYQQSVHDYAEAATRASTDLARRAARVRILRTILSTGTFPSE